MNVEPENLRILRLHKTWADRYTLVWQVFILVLFVGVYFLLQQGGMSSSDRAEALVLLAVMVLTAAIWQGLGLAVARIHMITQGIDLTARPTSSGKPS
jgi:hypothetical protein